MVVQDGMFLVELVDVYDKRPAKDQLHVSRSNATASACDTEWLVEVDPWAEYYVRLEVVGDDVDPDRVFLFYVSIDDTYLGYRQVLCRRDGFLNVGWYSFRNGILVGIDQGIQFQEATLFEHANNNPYEPNFRTDMIHMGRATVKIYEGILDGSALSIGNNSESFQPGQFLQSISLRCCAPPEVGSSYLNRDDLERLKKTFMKRRADHELVVDQDHALSTMSMMLPGTKRLKTETGSVSMAMAPPAVAASQGGGGGMECEY